MIPNRIVRYFFYLGYALGQGGFCRFSTFRTSLTHFHGMYLQKEFWWKNPGYYPDQFGRN